MGRNHEERSIGDEKQDHRHEDRHHDRGARNLRQHKGRVILGNLAGPGNQRVELGATMMASVMVCARMQIKRPDRRLLEFIEAGRANNPGNQPDADEQAGNKHDRLRRSARRSHTLYRTKHVIHRPYLLRGKAETLRNRKAVRLPASAHGCYKMNKEAGRLTIHMRITSKLTCRKPSARMRSTTETNRSNRVTLSARTRTKDSRG